MNQLYELISNFLKNNFYPTAALKQITTSSEFIEQIVFLFSIMSTRSAVIWGSKVKATCYAISFSNNKTLKKGIRFAA